MGRQTSESMAPLSITSTPGDDVVLKK